MGFKEWIVPQDKKFFGMLEAEAAKVLEGARALKEMLMDYRDIHKKSEKIKEMEHQADDIVHQICEALNRTFITPIDREDISALAYKMDEVLDLVNSTAIRLCVFKIDKPTKSMLEFTDIIVKSMVEINEAIKQISNMRNAVKIETRCVEVNRLENIADSLLHNSMAALFEEKDVTKIIKLKEIYEFLEMATDMCEDVANIINDVVTKYR